MPIEPPDPITRPGAIREQRRLRGGLREAVVTWYTLNCGDPMLCDPLVNDILEAFQQARRGGQLDARAAVFSRHESRGALHCELILYFNPAAAPLARQVGARVCAVPLTRGLSRLG